MDTLSSSVLNARSVSVSLGSITGSLIIVNVVLLCSRTLGVITPGDRPVDVAAAGAATVTTNAVTHLLVCSLHSVFLFTLRVDTGGAVGGTGVEVVGRWD